MAEMAVARDRDTSDVIASMTLADWLDDLTVRFLLNLPRAELDSIPRLCFQVEEAQWFYEDFIRPASPQLPSLNLREFCMVLFRHCPLLSGYNVAQHTAAYEEFLSYKVRVPVRGAILMDDSMDKVLLVRGWKKGASWSFPRGKINKDEDDLDCAAREVYEETGFDVKAAGLVEANQEVDGKVKSITVTMREQHMQLFVFRGVSLDTYFEPKTRKEISKIQWYNVKDLPGYKKQKGVTGHGQGAAQTSKFYMVAPFMGQLKKWIGQQRRKDSTAPQAGHQRNLSVNDGFQTGFTEDDGLDTEADFTTDNGFPMPAIDRSADELKRLLSIGGPSTAPTPSAAPSQNTDNQNALHSSNLLAMLKGSQHARMTGDIPHTPFEQVDPPIPSHEPETPQVHHARHPSSGIQQQYQMPPQFLYSPDRLQQQEQAARHASLPATALFESGSGHLPQSQQPGFANLPPHLQQQFAQQQQRQHSMPANYLAGYFPGPQFNQQGAHSESRPASQRYHPSVPGSNGQLSSPMQPVSSANRPQSRPGSYAPIGSDAGVPEPAKLPAPKLNAHSMKLLDAFKTSNGNKSAAGVPAAGPSDGQTRGQQQATLLDLFRKPAATAVPSPSENASLPPAPVSPALTTATDATERPKKQKGRRPTLNEMTRTLPPKVQNEQQESAPKPQPIAAPPKIQKPPRSKNTAAASTSARKLPQPTQTTVLHDMLAERPKSLGQLYDPSKPQKSVRTPSIVQKATTEDNVAPVSILPRPGSRQTSRSPKPSPKPSPKLRSKPAQPDSSSQPVPQFSILQRPGSSAGKGPRSPVVHSPLRHEAPKSTPQVLKRPSADAQDLPRMPEEGHSIAQPGDAGSDKKDQLLALFGKPAVAAPASTPSARPSEEVNVSKEPSNGATPTQPQQPQQQKDQLLNLFASSSKSRTPSAQKTAASTLATSTVVDESQKSFFNGNTAGILIKTPEPPPSPQLQPERKPSYQGHKPQNSQQRLLNLFTKQSSPSGLQSPGTPISPFTLGTPATREPPLIGRLPGTAYDSSAYASDASTTGVAAPRSRLGSMASVLSNGGGSGQQTPTESTTTPTEAKNMLLGYLNGVVQKEGYKSARRN